MLQVKKIVLAVAPLMLLASCKSTEKEVVRYLPINWCIDNIKEQETAEFTYTYEEINGDKKINADSDSYSYLVNTYYSYTKYDTWYCKVEFTHNTKYVKKNIVYIKCERVRK